MKRLLAVLVATCLLAGAVVFGPTALAPARAVTRLTHVSALFLLRALKVHAHTHTASYVRTRFTLWIDANGDCQLTRAEVLVAESSKEITENSHCTVETGRWVSKYDGKVFTKASRLQIDHLVPLENAWISGAYRWSAAKREAYANDLGYPNSLIAVSVHANESKGDRDPGGYLPPKRSYDCTYVKSWIGVKSRWGLTVTAAEKATLTSDLAKYCTSTAVLKPLKPNMATLIGIVSGTVKHAPTHTSRPTPTTVPTATATPTPVPVPVSAPVTTSAPVPTATPSATPTPTPTDSVYYANCDAVRAAGKAPLYRGQPGYRSGLDRDGDGIACEN